MRVSAKRALTRVGRTPWLFGLLTGTLFACGGLGDEGSLPPDVPDPATLQTPAGALARYRGAEARLRFVFEGVLLRGALLTDEMVALPTPLGFNGVLTPFDTRQRLETVSSTPYDSLHKLRAQVREARGFLAAYSPDNSSDLQAHMFALEGYAEVFLADLFCSGTPLSTIDFGGDFTLAAGSSTEEVYAHAIALFDSAAGLVADSTRFRWLTAVGRGRALLSLGRYAEATAAVADVPGEFAYRVPVPSVSKVEGVGANVTPVLTGLTSYAAHYSRVAAVPSAADREGGNGLDFRSSGDPRTKSVLLGAGLYGGDMYYPDPTRFPQAGVVTYVLANGIEARLIEAEAALMTGGDWLAKLNTLRTNGTFDTQPNPSDPLQTDTLWHAGSGGVAGLRPLDDPGVDDLRVDLVFRERAFWLYLTGHRQGDLRRLVQRHNRTPDAIYPTGSYIGASGMYGNEFIVPVPESEQQLNPKYSGCFHRNS